MLNERYENETVSHSGLSKLEISPKAYRNYKDRKDQDSARFFELGSAAHCYILEPSEFDSRYISAELIAPGGMMGIFVEELFKTRSKDKPFNKQQKKIWVENAYKKSGFKWSLDKVEELFNEDKNTQKYWKFKVEHADKVVLTEYEMSAIIACRRGIETHEAARTLIFGNPLTTAYNELEVIWRHPYFPDFKMKSILDRLEVDEDKKIAYLTDLKTTSKSVYSFKDSYKKYKYYRQAGLYRQAVLWWLEDKGYNVKDWTVEMHLVVSSTNGYGDCAVYKPLYQDLVQGQSECMSLLETMKWHFDNDKWDHPKEYYENNGVLTLKLDED